MANVNHKDLPNSELHEPKGISTASTGTVYVSDGAGSGTWQDPSHAYTLNARIDNISTADDVYLAVPQSGTITKIYSVIDGVLTAADAGLTFSIGAVPITGSAITVAYTGSAAGDVDSSTPSAANTVVAGDSIKISTDGLSTGTVACTLSLLISVE